MFIGPCLSTSPAGYPRRGRRSTRGPFILAQIPRGRPGRAGGGAPSGRGPRGALSLVGVEVALAKPDRFRRYLDEFVVVDIGDRLFEPHGDRRREPHRLVGPRSAHVGEFLALEGVHLEVVVAG